MENSELIGQIYEGVGDPELMLKAVERIIRLTGSRSCQFGVMDGPEHWLQASVVGTDPEALGLYLQHYSSEDRRLSFCFNHLGRAFPCDETVPDLATYERSALVNDFLLKYEARFALISVSPAAEESFVTLSLMRGLGDGRYEERQVRQIEYLLPHIQRAMALHIRLGGLTSSLLSLQSMVDHLDAPVVLVESDGALCYANEAGIKALGSGAYLTLNNGKVEPRSQHQKHPFADLLRGLATLDQAATISDHNSSFRLTDKEGHTAVLTLQQLRGKKNLMGMPTASVALFLNCTDSRQIPNSKRLQVLFQFTASEARVAESLMHGSTLEEIGENLNVTRDTLKSHLRWMFQKTGTHRQSQLVAALYSATTVRIT